MTQQRQAAFQTPKPSTAVRRVLDATLMVLAFAAVSGCSDPKAATKDNFRKGLTAFFGKTCAVLTPIENSMDFIGRSTALPATLQVFPKVDAEMPRFVALTSAGLLHEGPEHTTLNAIGRVEASKTYTLTDKGKPLWKASNSMGPGSPAGFCSGHLQVDDVNSFSDPVVQGGTKVSTVNFQIHAVYDGWTQAADIQAAFQDELNHAAPAPASLPMVLMNDGWTVATAAPETSSALDPLPQ